MSLVIAVNAADHVQGPVDAPVTLVEYGDYECPYCGEAYPIIKDMQTRLGEQLRFVFRNFPLTEAHPHAMHAAEFAETAAAAGLFWQAHDLLYENQGTLDDRSLLVLGEQIGLDRQAVTDGLDGRHIQKIRADFLGGVRSGVNGTPSLFVNGRLLDTGFEPDSLLAALQRAARSGH